MRANRLGASEGFKTVRFRLEYSTSRGKDLWIESFFFLRRPKHQDGPMPLGIYIFLKTEVWHFSVYYTWHTDWSNQRQGETNNYSESGTVYEWKKKQILSALITRHQDGPKPLGMFSKTGAGDNCNLITSRNEHGKKKRKKIEEEFRIRYHN